MTTLHPITLPDGAPAEARATWVYARGTPGTLSDARGWELREFVILDHPKASHAERAFVATQLTPPDHRP